MVQFHPFIKTIQEQNSHPYIWLMDLVAKHNTIPTFLFLIHVALVYRSYASLFLRHVSVIEIFRFNHYEPCFLLIHISFYCREYLVLQFYYMRFLRVHRLLHYIHASVDILLHYIHASWVSQYICFNCTTFLDWNVALCFIFVIYDAKS